MQMMYTHWKFKKYTQNRVLGREQYLVMLTMEPQL